VSGSAHGKGFGERRARGWEQAFLPLRPDGTTGWIKDVQVDAVRVARRAGHQSVQG
jgi:hypothetical protein